HRGVRVAEEDEAYLGDAGWTLDKVSKAGALDERARLPAIHPVGAGADELGRPVGVVRERLGVAGSELRLEQMARQGRDRAVGGGSQRARFAVRLLPADQHGSLVRRGDLLDQANRWIARHAELGPG